MSSEDIASAKQPHESDAIVSINDAWRKAYAISLKVNQPLLLKNHPVIIALFSSEGGQMTLYLPDREPIVAQSPPIAYQHVKSCAHGTAAMHALLTPFKTDQADMSWIASMKDIQGVMQEAQQCLPSKQALMTTSQFKIVSDLLATTIDFMNKSLSKSKLTIEEVSEFAHNVKPLTESAIQMAATIQVRHWMKVLDDWTKLVGDWDQVHAATNTIYVTRQNNILFSVLAQFLGRDAINRRLFLFETTSFNSTNADMLELMTRVEADRILGLTYFDNLYQMDFELMGGAAHDSIKAECEKRGEKPFLPKMARFDTTDWPWHTAGQDEYKSQKNTIN